MPEDARHSFRVELGKLVQSARLSKQPSWDSAFNRFSKDLDVSKCPDFNTVYGWVQGPHLPRQWDDLKGVVLLAGAMAAVARRSLFNEKQRADLLRFWQQRYEDACQERDIQTRPAGVAVRKRVEMPSGLAEQVRDVLPKTASGPVWASSQLVVGEIPREPPGFVARDAVDALEQALSKQSCAVVCALTGMRGIGKTHVAGAYARERVAQGWRLVGWVDAETRDGLLAGLVRLAARLGVPEEGDSLKTAKDLRDHLSTWAGPGLLVFDNATDPDGLRPLLPATGDIKIVITTTDTRFDGFGSLIAIPTFSRTQSLSYLQDETGLDDKTGATAVAQELGDLPVALAHAAHKIRSNKQLTYSTYLEELRRVPLTQFFDRRPGEDYRISVDAALLLSIQAAETDDSSGLTETLLRVIAALSPDGVRRELIGGLDIGGLVGEVRAVDAALSVKLS